MENAARSKIYAIAVVLCCVALPSLPFSARAGVTPGDTITKDQADKVADLLSPGNLVLVKQGMTMKIVPTGRLEWPPPYKAATEKYSAQVQLAPDGTIKKYSAGLPFPLVEANDPQAAVKVMWNFSYRPQYTDDVDTRDVEIASFKPGGSGDPIGHFRVGHFGFYNNTGRTEVAPTPRDPDFETGIRYKFGIYPFLEPAEYEGVGLIRYRYFDPKMEDNTWLCQGQVCRRVSSTTLSDILGSQVGGGSTHSGALTTTTNLDPDSFFGFAAKIEDFDYKLLGIKPMLASVHAENSPAIPCANDNHRTICPEDWEMRQLYVIEADARRTSLLGATVSIPKRIFYVDSEGWLITVSDQYDMQGKLWKTLATFNTYRDRPIPDAKIAIWRFKRIFQTALVDEDVQDGFSTVIYSPARDAATEDRESWYINMGIIGNTFFSPNRARSMTRY